MTELVVSHQLTREEDTFAMAVVEYGGNLGAAYRAAYGSDAQMPIARARELIVRPEIAKRIQQISAAVEDHAMVSLGSHLIQLAEIRDLAKAEKQFKVALDAEKARAEVAQVAPVASKNPVPNTPSVPGVVINIGSTPASVHEWSERYAKQSPVVIDAGR